jgi:NADAR domain
VSRSASTGRFVSSRTAARSPRTTTTERVSRGTSNSHTVNRSASTGRYMMIGKAHLFGDEAIAAQMLAAPHPGAVKALGRQVRDFDQATWDARCFDLVVAGNEVDAGGRAVAGPAVLGGVV